MMDMCTLIRIILCTGYAVSGDYFKKKEEKKEHVTCEIAMLTMVLSKIINCAVDPFGLRPLQPCSLAD